MNAPIPDHGDAMVDALLAWPAEERAAFVSAQGWPPDKVVSALARRSLALLDEDAPRALSLAECGDAVAARCGDAATRARADRAMAHALRMNGRYADALRRYDAARAGFVGCGESAEGARSLIGRVDALMYLGRYAEAMETARDARVELAQYDDHLRVARLDVNLGNVLHRLDRHAEALQAYERARETLVHYGDDLDLAIVDDNRGNVLTALNRFDAALDAYAAAQATYRAQNLDTEHAWSAYNTAYLYFLRGQYGRALAGLARVRAHFASLHDRHGLGLCDLDEAEVLLALNRIAEAGELATRAMAAFDALALRYEAAKARVFSALSRLDAGEHDAAEPLLTAARTLFEQEGNVLWATTIDLIVAELALQRGDPSAAARGCESALLWLESTPFTPRTGRGRVLHGYAMRALGDYDAAIADVRRACDAADTVGDRVLSYQAYHLLGRLHEDTGRLEEASSAYLHAAADVDWLRGNITRDDLRISFVRDKVALYEDAVRTFLRRGRVAAAFELVERAKARALIDLLAAGPAIQVHGDEGDIELAARIDGLRAELTALYNRLHGDGEGRQRYAEGHDALLAQMRQHERELVSALAALQTRQAGYASLLNPAAARLDDVRDGLAPGDALLEYYLLGDDVIAFVVTHEQVRVYGPLAGRREVDELVRRWRAHMTQFNYPSSFVQRHSARMQATALETLGALHRLLVAPLAEGLAGRSLIVVPHGVLHHVPFHALHDDRCYLVERHDVGYAPSATVLMLRQTAQPAAKPALVVGVPNAALPYIETEVEAVAACHPGAVVLRGENATRARVVAEAGRCGRVHLATHAIFRADNPLFSAVQLADDWLTVSDIYNLDLAADLVVLSACETGANTVLHGDELLGLTRGFLYAGARSLVVSLWAANDAATAGLMAQFHRAVRDGAGVRSAIRAAQCDIMAQHPHPYYWAPFIAYGQEAAGSHSSTAHHSR